MHNYHIGVEIFIALFGFLNNFFYFEENTFSYFKDIWQGVHISLASVTVIKHCDLKKRLFG